MHILRTEKSWQVMLGPSAPETIKLAVLMKRVARSAVSDWGQT